MAFVRQLAFRFQGLEQQPLHGLHSLHLNCAVPSYVTNCKTWLSYVTLQNSPVLGSDGWCRWLYDMDLLEGFRAGPALGGAGGEGGALPEPPAAPATSLSDDQ